MTSPSKKPSGQEGEHFAGERTLGPDEKIARIMVERDKGHLWCLAPDCLFYISVPGAPAGVMMAELRDFYRVHRRMRHPQFMGKGSFEYLLGEGWTDAGNK
jgi:hypothetical protein